ncbi:MAG TPA: Mpo1-like protein, partial [Steroidobacteraceae bacterium]|nr:Mpo1-like protein [Steroidobacteraceae bacterium]
MTDWLGEYGVSHQNPVNKLLHWICVPPIVLAVMGLLWSAPVPGVFADVSSWLNWATLAAAAALLYYLLLSPALAAGLAVAFTVLLLIT